MMETRLQSNEIRIPKNDFDLTTTACQFKSSFARTLSFSNTNNKTKSLDFGINFVFNKNNMQQQNNQQQSITEEQLSSSSSSNSSVQEELEIDNNIPIDNRNSAKHLFWNKQNNGQGQYQNFNKSRKSLDSTEIEVLRLRKECQNLIEENRRLLSLNGGGIVNNCLPTNNCNNVEAVILQTQVDTLQWQLKQVESSRQMYRAVMEEVVRFLERCHRSLEDAIQCEPISRSKSVHHVARDDEASNNLRARSSTNLIDAQKSLSTRPDSSPAGSYNNFKDFTWRRSPKHSTTATHSQVTNIELDPEKLSQDAFRLLRTAQNLLNTKEPVLIQTKPIIEEIHHQPTKPPQNNQQQHHQQQQQDQQKQYPSTFSNHPKTNGLDPQTFCVTFNRKLNIRNSRMSYTDDSVHSNSSTKSETDEEIRDRPSPPLSIVSHTTDSIDGIIKDIRTGSSADDESGFSSMSSFQEIGLPIINSTMMSSCSNGSTSDESTECTIEQITVHNINNTNNNTNNTINKQQHSTLTDTNSRYKIGLPLPINNHRRWDSVPVVPPKKSLHTFSTLSTSGDEALRVLWV